MTTSEAEIGASYPLAGDEEDIRRLEEFGGKEGQKRHINYLAREFANKLKRQMRKE